MEIVVAVKGVILYNGKMLMIKRASNDEVGADTWEMAGGKIDFGEKLEFALIREVFEETSLNVSVEKLLYASTFMTNPKRQLVLLAYLCQAGSEEVTLSSEHSAFMWATKGEVEEHLLPMILDEFKKHEVLELIGEKSF